MNKKIISFAGITRNTDDTISGDGECQDLLNMRIKDDALRPVPPPALIERLEKRYDMVFRHVGANYDNYICVHRGEIDAYTSDTDNVRKTTTLLRSDNSIPIHDIRIVGNTLSVINQTGIEYYLFKDQKYKYLGHKPPFPVIQFKLYSKETKTENLWCDVDPAIRTEANMTYTFDSPNRTKVTTALTGAINRMMAEANQEGYFVFPVIVRYALRLFDGNYILHSSPIVLLTEQKIPANISVTNAQDSNGDDKHFTDFYYDAIVHKHQLNFHANFENIEEWEDIITSIDVFVSKQIRTVDLNSDITSFKTGGDRRDVTITLNEYGDEKIKENILSASIFYKIHSFSLKDSQTGYIQKEGMLDNLELKETLPDDPFSHNNITGVSYVYNSRLHIGAVQSKLAPMLPAWIFANTNLRLFDMDANVIQSTTGTTEVYLTTDSGEKIVSGEFTLPSFRGFTPMISYPDSRAKKIIWHINVSGKDYHKVFDMKPHPYLNISYYIDTLGPLGIDQFREGKVDTSKNNDIEYTPNKLKVSEVNNPFYFPIKNTYTPSNGEIIAMCSNTADISTGQFGQYPLYVFCDDGIYSMFVGDGNIVYSRSAPLARDVCINKNVLPIDNAVIFITAQGIMAIAGSQIHKISTPLEGEVLKPAPIVAKILALGGTSSFPDNILDYMSTYNLGFNYIHREILISNPNKDYSYAYNMITGTWHRLSGSIEGYVRNSYPDCLALIDGNIYDMENNEGFSNTIIVSRPLKIGTLTHKRISQASLRGYFTTQKLGFYILGSNDCLSYDLVSKKETISETRDLIVKMNRSRSYKYFIICVAGQLHSNSAINFAEILVETSFANRLR